MVDYFHFETSGDRGILGCWRNRSALELGGFGSPPEGLRAAEGRKNEFARVQLEARSRHTAANLHSRALIRETCNRRGGRPRSCVDNLVGLCVMAPSLWNQGIEANKFKVAPDLLNCPMHD